MARVARTKYGMTKMTNTITYTLTYTLMATKQIKMIGTHFSATLLVEC